MVNDILMFTIKKISEMCIEWLLEHCHTELTGKNMEYGNLGERVCLPYKCLSNYFSYLHFLSFGVFHWIPVCQVLCYSKITLFFFYLIVLHACRRLKTMIFNYEV